MSGEVYVLTTISHDKGMVQYGKERYDEAMHGKVMCRRLDQKKQGNGLAHMLQS